MHPETTWDNKWVSKYILPGVSHQLFAVTSIGVRSFRRRRRLGTCAIRTPIPKFYRDCSAATCVATQVIYFSLLGRNRFWVLSVNSRFMNREYMGNSDGIREEFARLGTQDHDRTNVLMCFAVSKLPTCRQHSLLTHCLIISNMRDEWKMGRKKGDGEIKTQKVSLKLILGHTWCVINCSGSRLGIL